ncbi:MAG: hypothetical protein ABIV94_12265 [Acidimicrobiales bacterium]
MDQPVGRSSTVSSIVFKSTGAGRELDAADVLAADVEVDEVLVLTSLNDAEPTDWLSLVPPPEHAASARTAAPVAAPRRRGLRRAVARPCHISVMRAQSLNIRPQIRP